MGNVPLQSQTYHHFVHDICHVLVPPFHLGGGTIGVAVPGKGGDNDVPGEFIWRPLLSDNVKVRYELENTS